MKKILFAGALLVGAFCESQIIPLACDDAHPCPQGQSCGQGICQINLIPVCDSLNCDPGYKCKNNACEPIEFCPTEAGYFLQQAIYCPKRKFQINCPDLIYIDEPKPLFCGVKNDGTRQNFYQMCKVCGNGIEYFFSRPCQQIPKVCSDNQNCKEGICVDKCSEDSQCPYNWQICVEGECSDKCQNMECAGCKYGKCFYKDQIRKCTQDYHCECGQKCIQNQCTDQCLQKRCGKGQLCWQGDCIIPQENAP